MTSKFFRRAPNAPPPQWHRVYYFLAAFDVLIVLLGLFLTHQILRIYNQSVATNQQWVEQRSRVAELGTLAGAVNAPGNNVFDSHDVEGEAARMAAALLVFDQRMTAVENELGAQIERKGENDLAIRSTLDKFPADTAAVRVAITKMTAEAQLIFSYFEEKQLEKAGSRMAAMDRKYAHVAAALAQLREHIGEIQEKLFEIQTQSADSLSRFEHLLATFVLLMVTGAVVYGHKIKNQIESGASEKEGFLAELQTEIIERKAMESALRESEEKHRDLFENANDIIYTHDLAGNYTSINKACEKITGYTSAESLNMNIKQVVAPESLPEAMRALSERQSNSAPTAYETEIMAKDGRRITVEISSRLTFHHGVVSGVQGIARDITERRRVERERQSIAEIIQSVSQTSNLNTLFENVHRSVSKVVDAQNCFVALYEKNTGLFGMQFFVDQHDEAPPPLPLAKSRTAYIFRTGRPMLMSKETFEELLKEGELESVGTPPASWLGVPLATPAGIIGVMVVQHYTNPAAYSVRDLEFLNSVGGQIAMALERKGAEEALHETERKLALQIQRASLAAIEMNQLGEVVEWNPAAEKMFGYTREEAIGRSVFELIVPASADVEVGQTWQNLMSDTGGWRSTNENVTKDGRIIMCDWHNSTLVADGKVTGVASLVQDITERVQMEEALEKARNEALESARLKSEFLANMSHEIRTPMNGVIGMTGLLLDTDLTEDQREFAETIRSCGDSLLTIINDILDFSKIEAGKLEFETLDFDLANAVEGAVELLAERARGKEVELASLIHSDVARGLRGDPGRLRQVLTNLLGNALKFTEHGEVILLAEKESESDDEILVRFTVTDTGIGISEAAQQRLFQAFTQADGSTTRKYGGTGLGLAISRQLVELMGGQIGVKSVPGEGSAFWFTAKFAKQSAVAEVQETMPSVHGLRVLIVDDNATNRKILSHQVGSWGMPQAEAESGARALELMQTAAADGYPFDLAILDLMMPNMDGFELARRIKSAPALAATRLVMLTSYGQRGDGTTARELGIAAYLTKPVRQSSLFDCLTTIISGSSREPDSEITGTSKQEPIITRHVLNETNTMPIRLILLAEDNIVNQKVAVRQLQKLGYRADAVANGREALEALNRISYDVVLMDCQMPEMDGYEATAEIRRREGSTSRHTVIVAMTANALQGDRQKCIDAGMDDYISKPVKVEELAQVLSRAFSITDTPPGGTEHAVEPTPPVDLKRLHEATGEDLEEILEIYLTQMAENLSKLKTAVDAGNAASVDLIAHNCAGTSANCGMIAVMVPLYELERMGREGNLAGAEVVCARVISEFQRTQTFLKANLMQLTA